MEPAAARHQIAMYLAHRIQYLIDRTLAQLEERLDSRRFVRIHRSTIVNIGQVKEIVSWNGVTVTEAGVPAAHSDRAFRLYVETSGVDWEAGSIQTGIAIANASGTPTDLYLELIRPDGTSIGMTSTITIPGNGQIATFLKQIPGFEGLQNPFQGILRVSASSLFSSSISVIGLRGRYNERRDFLITTTPPGCEASTPSNSEMLFPHLADGGGYTTQFILFSGASGQSSSGMLRLYTQSGQPLMVLR